MIWNSTLILVKIKFNEVISNLLLLVEIVGNLGG